MKATLFIVLAVCVGSAASLHVASPSSVRPPIDDLSQRQHNTVPAATAQRQTLSLRGGASLGPLTVSSLVWVNIVMGFGYGSHAAFAPENFLTKFYQSKVPSRDALGITRWFGLMILQVASLSLYLKTQYNVDDALIKFQVPSQLVTLALYASQFNNGLMKSTESFYIMPVMVLLHLYVGWC